MVVVYCCAGGTSRHRRALFCRQRLVLPAGMPPYAYAAQCNEGTAGDGALLWCAAVKNEGAISSGAAARQCVL